MENTRDDLYKILGLKNSASDKEIKKAYKSLALKWHPDRNQDNKDYATEFFKKINDAYDILSDPEKKQIYDNRQFCDFNNFPKRTKVNTSKTFNFAQKNTTFNFSDSNDFFVSFFRNNFSTLEKNNNFNCSDTDEITHNVKIDLELLYKGGIKKFKISNNNLNKIFEINIQPGWKNGTKISFDDDKIGNVTFIVEEKENPLYKRVNDDIIYKYTINGDNIDVVCFSGKQIKLKNKKKGDKITVSGEGMPIRKNGKIIGYGDLIIDAI
jgi:DnaJ-class molecular chaperone